LTIWRRRCQVLLSAQREQDRCPHEQASSDISNEWRRRLFCGNGADD
jgi:hypothetical protein